MIGSISGSGALAIVVTAVATAVIVALLLAAVSLRRSARELQAIAAELADHASAVLDEAEQTIARAQGDLARVDNLMGSAEAITETTRMAHAALATPLIKLLALGAGTARAGRFLRKVGK